MSLKHGLLGFLSEQEMSGYDLEKLFSKSIGHFWSAKISQIYRDLHSMESSGWIQSKELVQSDRPNKKLFKITNAGYNELESWLLNYNIKNDFEFRISILMRIYFAAKIPKKITIRLLGQFRIECQKAIDSLSNVDEEIEFCNAESMEMLYTKATLSYGKKYYAMQIDWCTEIIEKLQSENRERY